MRARGSYGLAILGCVAVLSCSGSGQRGTAPSGGTESASQCAASGARSLSPIGPSDVGSTIALASWRGRTVAFVADEDERAVHAVELATKRTLTSYRLTGRPGQLSVLDDGRLVITNRDRSELVVTEPDGAELKARCTVPTAAEPVALAQSADRKTLFVSSAWGHALGVYRASDLQQQRQVELAREPRAVAVSSDGKSAFVAHAVGGHASVVDLSTWRVRRVKLEGQPDPAVATTRQLMLESARRHGNVPDEELEALAAVEESSKKKERTSCQGFALAKSVEPAGRMLAPQVLVDPGDNAERVTGYGDDSVSTEVPSVAVLDDRTGKPLAASLEVLQHAPDFSGENHDEAECLLPRAAIVDNATRTLLVACAGIDRIVGYDAAAASPARAVKQSWPVASGPTGMALDPARRRAVVWSQFERSLSVIPLDGAVPEDPDREVRKPERIALAEHPGSALPLKARLGRILFHASGDRRIARDGRACASCHPDGRDDGLVWATPNGPRRSVMLAGRLKQTAPFSWDGNHGDLEKHVTETFHRLNGMGGVRSVELEALVAYIESLPAPPSPAAADPALVARGRQLFASAETGCSGCHTGSRFTDNAKHDVSSRSRGDRSPRFNTPSLVHLSGRGPWFHDGRYSSLRQLLVGESGKMGRTAHLTERDLNALEAYLRTL